MLKVYYSDSDFTFVCPTEILAFNDALPEFKQLNTAVFSAFGNIQCLRVLTAQDRCVD